jgi:hypothetical protein
MYTHRLMDFVFHEFELVHVCVSCIDFGAITTAFFEIQSCTVVGRCICRKYTVQCCSSIGSHSCSVNHDCICTCRHKLHPHEADTHRNATSKTLTS